jgi:zinc protease
VAAIFAEIDSLARFGAGEKELAKIRETVIRSRETDLKENGFWLGQLAGLEQNGEDPRVILDPSDLLPLLTPERLKAAAQRYLDRSNYVRVTLLPEPKSTP